MKKINILLTALAAVPAYAAVKALCFAPEPLEQKATKDFDCDALSAAENLGEMIKLRTVSFRDMSQMDFGQFEAFPKLLEQLYPLCAAALSFERAGKTGLVYRWAGRCSDRVSVLMAHYDVVPAEEKWSFPPFCGEIRSGKVLGRGALDTKCTLCAIFEAVEALLKEGFTPENDIYLCFSGTEETAGEGAHEIVKMLEARSIYPDFTLDEGGAIVCDMLPGVKQPCAIIGIAEKGQMVVRITAKSRPGHASMPPKSTAVARLAKAINSIENSAFDVRLTEPVLKMIDTAGRYAPFLYRLIFASPKLFYPIIKASAHSFGDEVNALIRTTAAFTMLKGSSTSNVLPSKAEAVCDVRILPGTSCAEVVKHFKDAVDDKRIDFEVVTAAEPSAVSPASGAQWELLTDAIKETWDNIAVSPYLMTARSDSSVYTKICRNVYRFAPIALSLEESASIHAADECIPIEKLKKAVEFYYKLILKL